MEVEISGVKCVFDEKDWEWLKHLPLRLQKAGGYKNGIVYVFLNRVGIHRTIFELYNGRILTGNVVDHINRITTDNRIENLRQISNWDNLHLNKKKFITRLVTSKYIGVSKDKRNDKWRAQCRYAGASVSLGLYDTEYDAAVAHDAYAIKMFDNPLRLNFPETADVLRIIYGKVRSL